MIPDPLETAAWRTFGMLDADESATFDETAKHDTELRHACRDMDRLTAAIAVATTPPVAPRAGQLERLHLRLGLPARRRLNWPAISGWAAAAALGILALVRPAPPQPSVAILQAPATQDSQAVSATEIPPSFSLPLPSEGNSPPVVADAGNPAPIPSIGETHHLIQEIEVLRRKLESLQLHDRERFGTTPGMAWPVVMRMVPPDLPSSALVAANDTKEDPMLTAMLGDAIAISQETAKSTPSIVRPDAEVPQIQVPTAIPIYDAARDKGTLVVSNLPPKNTGESYNLWVTTDKGDRPIHVGRLPDSAKPGANSMDFSLGATAIYPSGFLLTRDKEGNPPPPSETTTILVGPR